MKDEHLFRPFFGDDLSSWRPWMVALRCLYGLPIKRQRSKELVHQCTGRHPDELPFDGFQSALFLTGRRSGKSRIAATVGAFEALFAGHETRLAKGEVGCLPVISPTRDQSSIVWRYIQGIFDTPLLKQQVADCKESAKTMRLSNGIEITVLAGDWRTIRGRSIVCAVVDECCFFHLSEECKIKSDAELIRALKPGLATTNGRLVAISSKYSKKGWAYRTWCAQQGSNKGSSQRFTPVWHTLVWDAESRTLNPTLSQAFVDAAYAEDAAAARSEFGNEWRAEISEFVPRSLIESLVVKGRKELLPRLRYPHEVRYHGFVDLSGGRGDDAALAVGHKEGRKLILDSVRVYRPPFNPHTVVGEMAQELKRFNIRRVVGDNYGAEFLVGSFRDNGIGYTKSDKPKSELYKELLPVLCSAEIELLDDERLVDQLSGLERRTRSGGKDVIDHPPGAHDDVANVVAGVAATKGTRMVGGAWK